MLEQEPYKGKEQMVRKWQRPREKRHTVIRTEQREVRIVVPPEVPHETRICIEDIEREKEHEIDQSEYDEKQE